jgi:hypothetical protein
MRAVRKVIHLEPGMCVIKLKILLACRLLLDCSPSTKDVTRMRGHHNDMSSLRRAFLGSDDCEQKFAQPKLQVENGTRATLIHVHVPKTGGTTLAVALAKEPAPQPNLTIVSGMPRALRAMPRPKRQALRCIRGHFSKGIGDESGPNQRRIFDGCTARDTRFHDVCQALFLPPTEARTIGT